MRTFPGRLAVRTPCHVDDAGFVPEERGAYCPSCRKTVHDFSSLGYAEAVALVAEARREKKQLCGALTLRDDGAILLADGYVRAESLLRKRAPAIVVASAIGLAACAPPTVTEVPALTPPPVAPASPPPQPVAAAPVPPVVPEPAPEPEPEPEPPPPPRVAPVVRVPVAAPAHPAAKPKPLKGGHTTKPPVLRGDIDLGI